MPTAVCKPMSEKGGQILDVRNPVNRALANRLGLVSWWKSFGSGGTVWRDLMRRNDCTLTGSTKVAPGGRPGGYGSVSSDGVDDYGNVSDSGSLDVSRITVDGWMYLRSLPSSAAPVACKGTLAGDSTSTWALYASTGTATYRWFVLADDDSLGIVNGTAHSAGNWAHIAGTFDGSSVKIYVHGQFVAEAAFAKTLKVSAHDITLAADPALSTRFGDSLLDNVRVWNRALPASHIQAVRMDDMRGNPRLLNWIDDEGGYSQANRRRYLTLLGAGV